MKKKRRKSSTDTDSGKKMVYVYFMVNIFIKGAPSSSISNLN